MDEASADAVLARFWEDYVAAGRGRARFVVRRPREAWRAWRATAALPVVEAVLDGSPAGRHIEGVLSERVAGLVSWGRLGVAVLAVPVEADDYLVGSSRQTLRRKMRKAQAAGVTVREVRDDEREALLRLADDAERRHPVAAYRVATPRNEDLCDHDLWLVAEGPAGEPMLLAVLPVVGSWASLRYFRTLDWSPVHSDTRYLATAAAVAALSRRGVRHLLDTEPPGEQSAGVRHFQRMLGFRFVRVRVRRRG